VVAYSMNRVKACAPSCMCSIFETPPGSVSVKRKLSESLGLTIALWLKQVVQQLMPHAR